MNENIKIDELARKYALTDEQLMEYLFMNGIDISNEYENVDLSNNKINKLLKRLDITKHRNHNNESGLKSIKIQGLFGKYDYSLNFKKDITIWVSENGVGKTTILNIIVAILTADERTLFDIDFRRIEVETSNKVYVIDKKEGNKQIKDNFRKTNYINHRMEYLLEDLERYLPISFIFKIRDQITKNGYIEPEFWDEIIHRLSRENSVYDEKLTLTIHRMKEMRYRNLYNEIYKIKDAIKEEIVFYPTYRRVEVGFDRIFLNQSIKYGRNELSPKYMGFGMGDVKKRIRNLLDKLRKDANSAYIEMNANIISELLEDSIVNYIGSFGKIDIHKVDVVIKRIGEERINNIDKLRSFLSAEKNNNNSSNIEFLIYYLQKLVKIYDFQEAIDMKLSKFASVCSKYLSGKRVEYDETMLTMHVYDDSDMKIDFDDLSSGEKQIVSIFSKVYLDVTSPCIFIIDEPEISLSIEWQKEFLKDIYESGKIALLIATTHSPFIFKNEYIDYAVDLDKYLEV